MSRKEASDCPHLKKFDNLPHVLTQLNSTQLNSTQLNSNQLKSINLTYSGLAAGIFSAGTDPVPGALPIDGISVGASN